VFALFSRKFRAGQHPHKYNLEEIIAVIRDSIPYYHKHTIYCKEAAALSLPKSTLIWIAKDNRDNVLV
jgi:hypothetical protein